MGISIRVMCLRHFSGLYLDGLRRTMKHGSEDIRSLGRLSNLEPTENESCMQTTTYIGWYSQFHQ